MTLQKKEEEEEEEMPDSVSLLITNQIIFSKQHFKNIRDQDNSIQDYN
jgi:hypothetical protein